jgi:hypothetical protein
MHLSSPGRLPWRSILLATCTALLLRALFVIPYHVPLRPSLSGSYIFGYNNRAGVVIVFLMALLFALFGRDLPAVPRPSGKPLTRTTLAKSLAITLLLGGILFLLTCRLDGYAESVYTVDRTRLLLEGHTPYRDFEFCYGILALCGPAFLVHTLHLSVPTACNLFWLAASLLGVAQLYLILSWAEFPPARRREVFLIAFFLFLPALTSMTTAYTYPRFLTGGLLAMLSQRLLGGTPRDRILAILLPIPGVALLLLISPEMGLAYTAGIVLYLLRFGDLRRPPHLIACLTMLAGLASILLFAAHRGAFITLTSFGGGAFNFPIVPAPHILLFLIAILICAAYLGSRLRRGENSPLLALGCIAPAMLPAALGRSDPGHVMLDGILILIIALLVCSTGPRTARLMLPATLCIFLAIPLVRGLRGLVSTLTLTALPYLLHTHSPAPPAPQDAWIEHLTLRIWGPVKGPANFERMRSRQTLGSTIDVPAAFGMPPGTVFAAPFSFFGNHTGPYHTPAVDEGYFLAIVDMVTPNDVARKIAEIDRHPERPLILPADAEYSCVIHPENARAEIESLFFYLYRAPAAHPGDITEPLCAFIRDQYHIAQPASPEHFSNALWLRNNSSPRTTLARTQTASP